MTSKAQPNSGNDPNEGDASNLNFPDEFKNAETLLNAEVHMLLEHRKTQNENAEDELELSDVFNKTLNYTQRFSRYKNRETMTSVRNAIAQKNLHRFELAALANLCPDTMDEAKSLIPSLGTHIGEDELQVLVEDISNKRNFQS